MSGLRCKRRKSAFGTRVSGSGKEDFESLIPSPEIRGREHRNDFEINQVIPMARPASQQVRIRRFHDLKTASPIRIHPARVIDDALREHPAATLEPFTDQRDATRLEVFDDHEDHAPESIPPWAQVKPCAGGAPRPVNPGLRQSPMGLERIPYLPSSVGHPLPWQRAVIFISIRGWHHAKWGA